MQRIRVPLGFVAAPLLFILAKPSRNSILAGSITAIVGLVIRGWASGHLRKNERLATSGPYAFTRNPLYFGTFIMGTGIAVCSASLPFIVFFETLYLAVYIPVMIAEARTMQELFAADYERYSRSVPLFLPRLTPAHLEAVPVSIECRSAAQDEQHRGFDRELYMKHREYRAAIGTAVVIILLILKFALFK